MNFTRPQLLAPLLTSFAVSFFAGCSTSSGNNDDNGSGGESTSDESTDPVNSSMGGSSSGNPMSGGDSSGGGGSQEVAAIPASDPVLAQIAGALDSVEGRLTALADSSGGRGDDYFCYTDLQGEWEFADVGSWCSGFKPGILWLGAELVGSEALATSAASWTADVAQVREGPDNDTGFQIYGSSGLGLLFHETHDATAAWKENVLAGAASLYNQRYNPTIGAFRSWAQESTDPLDVSDTVYDPDAGGGRPGGGGDSRFEVNIDMLMNMELVLSAAELLDAEGNTELASTYRSAAETHFDTTWRDFIREDGSHYHVVQYGPAGEVLNKRTHQGYNDESTWSRGQAWAVYGHAMFHRYVPMDKWVERGTEVTDYYLTKTEDAVIPPSDFDQPEGAQPRDSSAAAIVCSGFLEMYSQRGATDGAPYLEEAARILEALISPEYMEGGPATQESLLWACTEKHGDPEVGCAFGDYYFLECMNRYVALAE